MEELLKLEHGCIYHLKSINTVLSGSLRIWEALIIYKDPDIAMKCRRNYLLSFEKIAASNDIIGIEDLTMEEWLKDIKKFMTRPNNIFEKIEIHDLPLFLHLYKFPKFMTLLKRGCLNE